MASEWAEFGSRLITELLVVDLIHVYCAGARSHDLYWGKKPEQCRQCSAYSICEQDVMFRNTRFEATLTRLLKCNDLIELQIILQV